MAPSPSPGIVLAHWPGLDVFGADALDRLDALGTLLDREPIGDWNEPRAADLLARADVIVGHWGCPRIDRSVIDRAPALGLFAYAAGTLRDTLDPDVLDGDLRVTTGAPANAEPVAEYTVAMILLANKDVLWRRDELRDRSIRGRRAPRTTPIGNWNKTIGIVGASMVGRRVVELLQAFPHLRITLFDPFVEADEARTLGVEKLELDALCASADVLSIHAPDLPSTQRMIGAAELGALRDGATVINTARGALLDHDALSTELVSGRITAVLDVTDPEPLPRDSPLRSLPNVFLTPHLAGSEGTELERLADHVVDEVRRWRDGEPARNPIHRTDLDRLA